MTTASENVSAGQQYVLQLYADVENITTKVADYNNLIANLTPKYSEKQEITKEDYALLEEAGQNCRFWANRLYTKFMGLKDFLKIPADKIEKIKETFNKISTKQIAPYDDCLEMAIIFNELLVNNVFEKYFSDSNEALRKITG